MQHPDYLKNTVNTSTGFLAIATLLTGGICIPMWQYKNTPVFEQIQGSRLFHPFYLIILAMFLSFYLISITSENEDTVVIAIFSLLAYTGMQIFWAFKIRSVLETYALQQLRVQLPMNSFYTFIFHVFYINYCLNDLPNVVNKSRMASALNTHPQNTAHLDTANTAYPSVTAPRLSETPLHQANENSQGPVHLDKT